MSKTNVITISLHKGGVGKSSLVANLAYAFSKMNKNVLIIDTDSQMNLTRNFGINSNEKNFYQGFVEDEDLYAQILRTQYPNLDIIVGDVKLAQIENIMTSMTMKELKLKKLIKQIKNTNEYDYIFIDTSPNLGQLVTATLYATDYVIIPLELSSFAIEGLNLFTQTFYNVQETRLSFDETDKLELLGVVFNKIDNRESLNEVAKESVSDIFDNKIFTTEIPTDANIKKSQWINVPLGVLVEDNKIQSRALNAFNNLAKEVESLV